MKKEFSSAIGEVTSKAIRKVDVLQWIAFITITFLVLYFGIYLIAIG